MGELFDLFKTFFRIGGCIQVSQEAGKVVWYSHLFKNFPQFIVIYTVKGFGIISKAEVDFFFWNCLAFSMVQWMLAT